MSTSRAFPVATAFVMAFCALFAMSVMSGWHAAAAHGDPVPAVQLVSGEAEMPQAPGDAGDPIHVAAHAIGHGMAMPAETAAALPTVTALPGWPIHRADARAGIDPRLPLRPPQR